MHRSINPYRRFTNHPEDGSEGCLTDVRYRRTLRAIATASGASVAPRLGPVIDTRYCEPRRESGTVIANVPFATVRFAPHRTHPDPPQPEQSKNAEWRIGVPAFVGDVPVTGRP